MDPDSFSKSKTNAPRKVRFAPKAPPKRESKLVLPKAEKIEKDAEDVKAEHLLRRLNETSVSGKAKAEKKVRQSQVAFGFGGSSSLRSYGSSKSAYKNQGSSDGGALEKEYKEPWNYCTYYPATLPLRRPYSGNPEFLDVEEFSEDPQNTSYDEHDTNSAAELGLLDDNEENKKNMFFLQLPKTLPTAKQSTDVEPQEMENNPNSRKSSDKNQKPCTFEEMPEGLMGKMLVYKSGAVKLKVGNTLYDVSTGLDFVFAQDVVAINTENKHCCNLGEISTRAIITPDIDSILDDALDL